MLGDEAPLVRFLVVAALTTFATFEAADISPFEVVSTAGRVLDRV